MISRKLIFSPNTTKDNNNVNIIIPNEWIAPTVKLLQFYKRKTIQLLKPRRVIRRAKGISIHRILYTLKLFNKIVTDNCYQDHQ